MRSLCVAMMGALLVAQVSACGGNDVACTMEARASVMVAVVQTGGAPLPGAYVAYAVNGGPVEVAECADPTVLPAACTLFVAGYEIAGDFVIEAEKSGYDPAGATVSVQEDADGCHVVTQQVTLSLNPA